MAEQHPELSSKFYPPRCMFAIGSLFCGFYSILAAVIGDFVIVFDGLEGSSVRLSLLFLAYLLTYLMVSTHPYYGFKKPHQSTRLKTFQIPDNCHFYFP